MDDVVSQPGTPNLDTAPAEPNAAPAEPNAAPAEPEPAPVSPDLAPTEATPALADEPAGVVATSGTTVRNPARMRWIVAGVIAVLAIAGGVAAAMLLGSKPAPEALQYLPADSVVVIELRPDLPGDQRQQLGNFLAHFPGFADQSILTQKLDETFDRIVSAATNGSVDYATRIKPLLTGPMVAGLSADGISSMTGSNPAHKGLLVATTNGSASCGVVFGAASPLETYRDVKIESAKDDLDCAVDGTFMLIGDVSSIRAGIDAHLDHAGIDTNKRFSTARDRLEGDQLGLVFVDGQAVAGLATDLAPGTGIDTTLASKVPEWIIVGVRVFDDALHVDMQSAPVPDTALPDGVPTDPPPATSRFAPVLPANTLAFVEAHGMGANLQRALAMLKADPNQADAISQIEGALTAVGGIQNLAGWIEDLGVAAIPTGDSVGGVILLRGTDAAAVSSRLAQIRNLLVLASIGSDIKVTDTDHAGVTISTVDLGDIGSLLSGLGVDPGIGTISAGITFSLAARDDVLMLGVGSGAIEAVLDATDATSLAKTGAYQRVISLTGSPNDVEVYVAIDGLLGFVESNLPAGVDMTTWTQEFKPYLDHLAAAGDTTVTSDAGTRSRFVITVK